MTKLKNFLNSARKALVPLLLALVSQITHQTFDWNTPSGRWAALGAVLTSIGVYITKNRKQP